MSDIKIGEVINNIFKSDQNFLDDGKRMKEFIKKKYNREFSSYQELNDFKKIHPDFVDFKDEDKNNYVISFFADIKGSTKLSAYLKPRKVMKIKKIILDVISEIIFAFDGYVARYQGDAVMAFFNNDKYTKSISAWNAIFAANEIIYIIEKYIAPRIDKEIENSDIKLDIGLRIGIDYGHEDSVVWGKVGSKNNDYAFEHTAMGFNVDVAAKIQGEVSKNQIGLGENIVEFLVIDKVKYLKEKQTMEFGKKQYSFWKLKRFEFYEDIKKH